MTAPLCYATKINFALPIVVAAALIAAAIAISHRYEIRATACSPSETVCSRTWRVDQWTGAMSFCEYKGLPDCIAVPAQRPSAGIIRYDAQGNRIDEKR
jgi:hypothetical protein